MVQLKEIFSLSPSAPINLSLTECQVNTPCRYKFDEKRSLIGCNVCIAGKMLSAIASQDWNMLTTGLSGIWGSPASIDMEFETGQHRWLSVSVRREYLVELIGDCAKWSRRMQKMLFNGDMPFVLTAPAGAGTLFIANQICNCPFDGKLADSYKECKAKELMFEELDRHFCLRSLNSNFNFTVNRKKVEEAWSIIRMNIENPLSIYEVAKNIGMSESTLKRSFRKIYGVSIFAFFQNYRMSEARKLLENGEHNVTEVAFKVGYANSGHFSRAFSKHFGMPPKTYQCKKTR